jgi:small subunit ribosomal protein S1
VEKKEENFKDLLDQYLGSVSKFDGKVLKGRIMSIDGEYAIVDVGLKSDGKINISEFSSLDDEYSTVKIGDIFDVYIERFEDKNGEIVLSCEKAKREATWIKLESAYGKVTTVEGEIIGHVKGGYTVKIFGILAFLPSTHVDPRGSKEKRERDISLIKTIHQFKILKIDRMRGNIVVSRKDAIDDLSDGYPDIFSHIAVGQVISGVVSKLTSFGAFVAISESSKEGLIPLSEISWRRFDDPAKVLHVGQQVKVQVIGVNKETQRISLSMKHLEEDAWNTIDTKMKIGEIYDGTITRIMEYGILVEIDKEPGIEGMVLNSDISWNKQRDVSMGKKVMVMVADINKDKRTMNLNIKACLENPWELFAKDNKPGDKVSGKISSIAEFGIFVNFKDYKIDGVVRNNDISWDRKYEDSIKDYKVGDDIEVVLLDTDLDKGRIALSVKALIKDEFQTSVMKIKKGSLVTCVVSKISEDGLIVSLADTEASGFIKSIFLGRSKSDQNVNKFSIGDKLDAKVMSFDKNERLVILSVKALEIEEEKDALKNYGNVASGASLGDILGAALKRKAKEGDI